jgi:phage gp16-like protein
MTATTLRAKVAGRVTTPQPTCPTVGDYVQVVAEGYQPRSRRTYNSYWRLTVELLGDTTLDQVTVDDLTTVAEEAARRAKQRRAGSDGRASRESCVAAMRAVFTRAHKAGFVQTNPALLVDKPRRLPNRRRALNQTELNELWEVAAATTKDPLLDPHRHSPHQR